MNQEAERLLLTRKAERDASGKQAQRRQALETLKLRTVIKESHCSPVHSLCFNSVDPECSNIFATVGKNQATVYDDLHMGDYIGVVAQYTSAETEHSQGKELHACAWLNTEGWTQHPQGDACLAVSGEDTDISVISIVESRVLFQLRGHKKKVVDLSSCTGRPNLLASLSKDGELRLWDVPSETCLAAVATEATSLALHPNGGSLVTGGKRGGLHKWDLPLHQSSSALGQMHKKQKKPVTVTNIPKMALKPEGESSHLEAIDCIQFLDSSRLVSKSADGRCIILDLPSNKMLVTWKVPNCMPSGGLDTHCRFSTTPDGAMLCAGNSKGDTYVYETETGERVAHVSAIKVTGPVKACGLSEDCRHLLAAMGNGFIFRFESMPDEK